MNVQSRFMVDDHTWPPEQLKCFTPLLLVHYQGNRNSKQVTAMAKLMRTGEITSVAGANESCIARNSESHSHEDLKEALDATTVTKRLEEILVSLEKRNESCFILTEGAPGIGKSVLLKEIAYQWGKKHLLQAFKLVLLISLRDPLLQQAKSIPDVLQSFCRGDPDATKITTMCSKYLFENGGKDLVFLFDGFDELPEDLRTKGLIVDIIRRRVLPLCGLVVSSRPHATRELHKQATLRVDILGFTEKERQYHIQQVLHGQPHKIKELTQYFEHHISIGSLCYVPFNLIVLLYLYKQGISLPKNSTELYSSFICHTVYRHLTKQGHASIITKLTDLPTPCNKIIEQLSKLSLEALNDNKLVFSLDEIKAACPDITVVPGAINGFGLLQAVEHFGLIGVTTTFSFLHFSIQEYLAAHHIISLPAEEELSIIKKKFWSNIHFNMFSIYISLTKGQRPSLKQFLSGGNKAIAISDEFLYNQFQCFRLYRCFHEANDTNICKNIEQSKIFNSKVIDLSRHVLTTSDVECLALFLTSSFHKQWLELNLYKRYIQDHGLHILHHALYQHTDIAINKLRLSVNGLTTQSSSLISEITLKCKVKSLLLSSNYSIGEEQQLYSVLMNSTTVLEELYMYNTKLSSNGAIDMFVALNDNNTLRKLDISLNDITDDACNAIATALKQNGSLVKLWIYDNPLSGEAILNIMTALKCNNTLVGLWLPHCSEDIEKKANSLQEAINKMRQDQECQVKLRIYFW